MDFIYNLQLFDHHRILKRQAASSSTLISTTKCNRLDTKRHQILHTCDETFHQRFHHRHGFRTTTTTTCATARSPLCDALPPIQTTIHPWMNQVSINATTTHTSNQWHRPCSKHHHRSIRPWYRSKRESQKERMLPCFGRCYAQVFLSVYLTFLFCYVYGVLVCSIL